MKKKVLFFLQSGVGGAERVTVTIAKSLSCEKYEVIFCILDRPIGNVTIEAFIPDAYEKRYVSNAAGIKLVLELKKMISSVRPDIIFSSMMFINTKLLAISWLFPKIKFIVRNNNYLHTLSKKQKLFLRISYYFADCVVAQTDEMRTELITQMGMRENKVITIPNPLDISTIQEKLKEKSPYRDNAVMRFVALGRFFPVKGFDILVQAFRIVRNKMPNAELIIVGNTTGNCTGYYNKIVKLINQLQLNEYVHCVGFQTNPYIYVQNADCFVLSSRNEGLPNVLIEALYLGVPAAATTCIPVISRIVEEGKTGFLAETENPESLAEAMLKSVALGKIISNYPFDTTKYFEDVFNRIVGG